MNYGCQICDHTLHTVTKEAPHTWWCPRCGTLHNSHGSESPLLVMRCQHLYRIAGETEQSHMHQLGIVESLWPPDKAPQNEQ